MSMRSGPVIKRRPRCEKEGFCQQKDWEGRCLDPERECEWNEVVRILARRLLRPNVIMTKEEWEASQRYVKEHSYQIESQEGGGFVAKCQAYPGTIGRGETEEEAIEDLVEAIKSLNPEYERAKS